jgi:hypothetical protein
MAAQLRHRRNVGGLVGIRVQREVLGHLPEEDLAIVRGGCDQRVVEGTPAKPLALSLSLPAVRRSRVPVGVEDGGGVPAEEGDLVGRAAALVEGDDGKSAAAAGLPVDCDVLGVGLCV